jgi:hypothetical protein
MSLEELWRWEGRVAGRLSGIDIDTRVVVSVADVNGRRDTLVVIPTEFGTRSTTAVERELALETALSVAVDQMRTRSGA